MSIAEDLAKILKVKQGSVISILINTFDGAPNASDLTVKNIYNTGNPATNDKFIILNLKTAQKLMNVNAPEKYVIVFKDDKNLDHYKKTLIKDLKKNNLDIDIQEWTELSPSYLKVKKMFTVIFRVLMVIVSAIVLLTIINIMQLSINERSRELGIMRAVGIKKMEISKLFAAEGLILSVGAIIFVIPILFLIKIIFKILNLTFIPPVASIEVPIDLKFEPLFIIPAIILFIAVSTISSYLVSKRFLKQQIQELINDKI